MNYEIYNPEITTVTAVDTYDNAAGLTYVSNSSLTYFGGKFWAVMDGTTLGTVEGSTGQQVWMVTSEDAVTWGAPFQPFRDADYCTNPVDESALDWQPNLVVVGDELWCTWGLYMHTYVSKLTDPEGLWTNYRFEFDADNNVTISDTVTGDATGGRDLQMTFGEANDYWVYPTQNPVVLSNGTVVCPTVAETYSVFSNQITTTNVWLTQLKKAVLLKTNDGVEWSATVVDTSAFGDFSPLEPFIVENPVGHVYCFVRNLDPRGPDTDFLLVARSVDGGETFTPAESSGMVVPSTRGYALKATDKRWVMLHCDHAQHSTGNANLNTSANVRRNGALYWSWRGSNDFSPGINFSGDESSMNYPQGVVVDGYLYINFTSGIGQSQRRSLKVVKIPLPDDDTLYIHPRSNGIYDPPTPTAPELVDDGTPYYHFNGANRVLSTTPVAATTGITYTAWLEWGYESDVVMDCRQDNPAAFGQGFFLRGLSVNGLNVLHGYTLRPGVPTFIAAVIDNTPQTITVYISAGDTSFTTVTGYFKSLLVNSLPSDGDNVTINGVTYTFRNSPSLTNEVQIGASATTSAQNLVTKIATNSMSAVALGAGRLICARSDLATFSASSGSASITVETGVPLTGGPVSYGKAATGSLASYTGKMYEARIYNSALSEANLRYLHNAKASNLGNPNVTGSSSAPGSPFLILDPGDPDEGEFASLTTDPAAYCEVVDDNTLRIHGEGSASIELPYGTTQLTIKFKLGATPTSTDRYTIATFGTAENPARLYIDAAEPTKLYLNRNLVTTIADPTAYHTVTVIVSANKASVGGVEFYAAGKPRCFLGDAYPQGLLTASKSIDYDLTTMTGARA